MTQAKVEAMQEEIKARAKQIIVKNFAGLEPENFGSLLRDITEAITAAYKVGFAEGQFSERQKAREGSKPK